MPCASTACPDYRERHVWKNSAASLDLPMFLHFFFDDAVSKHDGMSGRLSSQTFQRPQDLETLKNLKKTKTLKTIHS